MQHDYFQLKKFGLLTPPKGSMVFVMTKYMLASCFKLHSERNKSLTFDPIPGVKGVCKDRGSVGRGSRNKTFASMLLHASFTLN